MRITTVLAAAACLHFGCGKVGDLPPDGASPDVPEGSTTFKLTASGKVDLVAVQDGDGPFTVLTASGGVYTTALHSERFGMLAACLGPGTADGSVDLKYGTITDGASWFHPGCTTPDPGVGSITGLVSGAGTDPVRVSYNFFGQQDLPAMTSQYTLNDIPAGKTKLIAQQLVAGRPVKFVVVETTITAGVTTTVNFDFAAGFAPITRNIAMDPNIASFSVTYRDAINLVRIDRPTAPFTNFRTFPGNQLGVGLTRLTATEAQGTASQFAVKYFKDPIDQTIPFPAPLSLPTAPTATRMPYPVVEMHIPKRTSATYYFMSFAPSAPPTDPPTVPIRSWSVLMTAGWVAKAPSTATDATFKMPDFTGLAGWSPNFELPAGTAISWTAEITQTTGSALFGTIPSDQFPFTDGAVTQTTDLTGELPAPN